MSWAVNEGVACFDGNDENTLSISGVLTPGANYYIEIYVSGSGSIKLGSFHGHPIISETTSGVYQASQSSFTIVGEGEVCIDNIVITQAYDYTILDQSGGVVYTSTTEDVIGSDLYLRYQVNWESLGEGCYTIELNDGIEYISECFYVKLEHDCTILLAWTNEDSAFGLEYDSLEFTQSLRVLAKLWQPKYASELKETFVDSKGKRKLLYTRVVKDQLLTINEIPEYLHDALAIGVNHDSFTIEGTEYVFEETDISPQWRNSSNLAPVLLRVIKKSQNLINSNCG